MFGPSRGGCWPYRPGLNSATLFVRDHFGLSVVQLSNRQAFLLALGKQFDPYRLAAYYIGRF